VIVRLQVAAAAVAGRARPAPDQSTAATPACKSRRTWARLRVSQHAPTLSGRVSGRRYRGRGQAQALAGGPAGRRRRGRLRRARQRPARLWRRARAGHGPPGRCERARPAGLPERAAWRPLCQACCDDRSCAATELARLRGSAVPAARCQAVCTTRCLPCFLTKTHWRAARHGPRPEEAARGAAGAARQRRRRSSARARSRRQAGAAGLPAGVQHSRGVWRQWRPARRARGPCSTGVGHAAGGRAPRAASGPLQKYPGCPALCSHGVCAAYAC